MSRSQYDNDDCDGWALIRWRGAVASATNGARGQALLRDLLTALDAMPDKRLIAESLAQSDGAVCALGALGKMRGIDMSKLDPEEPEQVAQQFNIAGALAREIFYKNDECSDCTETEWQRWTRMRRWVVRQIKTAQSNESA